MPTTINAQNALQIREKPMSVYINFQTGSSAVISSYSVTSTYKNYDSTLDETAWSMRNIADLQGDGFPLDGSYELYDSSISPSSSDGKLGVRGVTGSNVVIAITSATTMTAITVASANVDTITVGGTSYTGTGLNVIPLNAKTATLTFTPTDANHRVYVDYIVPGIILNITNTDLISCTLALRSNLSVADHSWQESEIEIQTYYPYSIADSFAYVQTDWPITYKAGYDADLSTERKFYLSEPITQVDNIITIRGVDASHWLDDKTIAEHWLETNAGGAYYHVCNEVKNAIENSGITLKNVNIPSWQGTGAPYSIAVIPEMSARDMVSGVMNLTMNHKRNGTYYGVQFVDAGIPTLEFGDGTIYGNSWSINKSDCGEWTETYEQNIATLKDSNSDRKFAETFSVSSSTKIAAQTYEETAVNQIIDTSLDGFFYYRALNYYIKTYKREKIVTPGHVEYQAVPYWQRFTAGSRVSMITKTPTRIVFKVNTATDGTNTKYAYYASPATISGGVNSYSNPNALPGVTVEMEPFIYGKILDTNSEMVINYNSLFNRSNHTVSFTYKGDPRMQPLDYLAVTDDVDNSGTTQYRITSIELTHEGGGTIAKIEAREWT